LVSPESRLHPNRQQGVGLSPNRVADEGGKATTLSENGLVSAENRLHPTLQGPGVLSHQRNFYNGTFHRSIIDDLNVRGVDLVVTWLNNSSPIWRSAQAYNWTNCDKSNTPPWEAGVPPPFYSYGKAVDESGFDLRDSCSDVRWLLRSYFVYLNSSLLNSIIILHSDLHPPPSFLQVDHPRIRFVKHSQLLPSHTLPTFSRTTIVSQIHRIRGLREWFLVTPDDAFLVGPLAWEHFVERPSSAHPFGRLIATADSSHQASLQNRYLIQNAGVVTSEWAPTVCCRIRNAAEFTGTASRDDLLPAHCPAGRRKRTLQLQSEFWNYVNSRHPRWYAPPPVERSKVAGIESIHTNGIWCQDIAFKTRTLLRDDYPCFRHGQVSPDALAALKMFLSQLDNNSTMFLNVQGPGMDDGYGGFLYNKVNPISEIVKSWFTRRFSRAMSFEKPESVAWEDRTSKKAVNQLKYKPLAR